jgi:hypothetical protein
VYFPVLLWTLTINMDKTTLPSHSTHYDKKMKEVLNNLQSSKRLLYFLALTLVVNLILTYGLIFHPPPPSVTRCVKLYPHLAVPAPTNIERSTDISLNNDIVVADVEPTALAVRSTGEF